MVRHHQSPKQDSQTPRGTSSSSSGQGEQDDHLSRTLTQCDDDDNHKDQGRVSSRGSPFPKAQQHGERSTAVSDRRQVAAAERLGVIMVDTSLDQRLDALKAVLVFLTPGEVKAFIEVMICQGERSEFRGVQAEVLQGPVAQVTSDNAEARLQGLAVLRSLVCKIENAQFEAEALLDAGLLPKIIALLGEGEAPDVQVEAAWILCNVFSGPSHHTHYLVAQGAVPALLPLLSSPVSAVRDQALWALGNCAGDSPAMRDTVLRQGLLDPLLQTLQPPGGDVTVSSLRVSCWALCNLVVRKGVGDLYQAQQPPWPESRRVLEALGWVLRHVSDKETLGDACWALRSMLTLPVRSELVEVMSTCGVTEGLFRLMGTHASSSTRRHAELTMTKVLASHHQHQHALRSPCKARQAASSKAVASCADKALQLFLIKLQHRMPRVRLYSCRALALLVHRAQQRDQQQQPATSGSFGGPALPSMVSALMHVLEEEQDEEVQLEALAALRAALQVGLGGGVSSSQGQGVTGCSDDESEAGGAAGGGEEDSSSSTGGSEDDASSSGQESGDDDDDDEEDEEDEGVHHEEGQGSPREPQQWQDADHPHLQQHPTRRGRQSVLALALVEGQRPLLRPLIKVLAGLLLLLRTLPPPTDAAALPAAGGRSATGASSSSSSEGGGRDGVPGPAAVVLALDCLWVLVRLARRDGPQAPPQQDWDDHDLQRALLALLHHHTSRASAVASSSTTVARLAARVLSTAFPGQQQPQPPE